MGKKTMKLQNFQTEYRGVSRIPTAFKKQIFPTLVHGRKPLNNVTKSTVPGLVRVPEGHRFLWNIINKRKLFQKHNRKD